MVNAVAVSPKKTPHYRRREQVYMLLDEATTTIDNPTYNELIEYVRARTGKGCSRKLISQWKKEQNNIVTFPTAPKLQVITPEKIIPPEAPAKINKPSNVIALPLESQRTPIAIANKAKKSSLLLNIKSTFTTLGLAAILWTASTSTEKVEKAIANEPLIISQNISPKKNVTVSNDLPRKIKITVNISKPEDLRVKQGEEVIKGQVIGDRTLEKQQLLAKKRQLEISIQQASLPILPPIQSNFDVQSLALAKAKVNLTSSKIDIVYPSLNFIDPELQQIFEADKLTEINRIKQEQVKQEQETKKQQINIETALARLEEAKVNYQSQLTQYQQSVERQRLELSSLRNQLADVERQLSSVSEVRSPYSGTVRKIKIQGQENNIITAEITLDVKAEED